MTVENRGQIQLVGTSHWVALDQWNGIPFDPGKGNYTQVKKLLRRERPAFVTLEVELSAGLLEDPDWFGTKIYTNSRLKLAMVELGKRFQQYGEYTAAIIYCKRNNIPLYFVDKYDIPPERAANLNVTESGNPSKFCTPVGEVKADSVRDTSMRARNTFMAATIDLIAQKYPGQRGMHIGGMAHISKQSPNKTESFIQDLLQTSVAEIILLPYPKKRSALVNGLTKLRRSL